MFSSRSISTKFAWLALLFGAAGLSAQIDPNQVNWPTGTTGCVYAPATNTCVSPGGAPSGTAGGDLSGSYPNPGVAGFGGIPFSNNPAPDLGDLICYDGVEYTPCPPEAGAAQILYLTNTASDIGSDFLWNTGPLGAQFTATQTIPATTTKTAIQSFATASTFPDATTIPAGEWQADSYVQVSGAANTTTLQIDVYDVHSDGSSPVLLFSFPNQTISGNGTGIQEQSVEAIEPAFTMAAGATDRLLITYSMTKTGGPSITGTLYGGGSANYSHVHTPIGTAGSTFNVNSSPVSNPNLNATTPSADSGYTAATPKVSGSNVIVETPNYTGTSPIVVTGQAIGCPTCGTSSGGTNVSLNSGSTVANLGINGFMPQACADTSGSGTAQSCTTGASFTPQADNCIVYTTTTANSGTGLTVNINSLGAKNVAIAGASGWTTTLVASSSIPANKPMHLCYDGTNWDASGTGYAASGVTSTGWTTLSFNSTPTTTFPGCGSAEAYQSTISIPMSYGTALRIKASLVRPNTSTGMDVAVATAATGVGGYEIAAQADKNQVLYYFNSSASNTAITASGTTYSYDQALPTPLNLAVYPMSSTENYLLGSAMVATVNNGLAQSQSISGQNGTLDLGSSSVYVFVCAPSSAAGIVGAAYMLSPTPW